MTSTLPIGTKIKFTAKDYNNVIYTTKIVEIVYPGELTLDSETSLIFFKLEPISTNPIICPKNSSITIKITDITYEENEGILLELKNSIINNNTYKTNIIWSLKKKTLKNLSVFLFYFKSNRRFLH